jgi:hypothetical protein
LGNPLVLVPSGAAPVFVGPARLADDEGGKAGCENGERNCNASYAKFASVLLDRMSKVFKP